MLRKANLYSDLTLAQKIEEMERVRACDMYYCACTLRCAPSSAAVVLH